MPSGESEPLLDYATLFNAGLRFTQTLAADHWTDYNLHDPGVTILQQLCYALTDLAYRARWPVEDLLAQPPKALPGAGPAESLQSTLFDGPHILTCAPVTAHDYRTLLYAQVEALENAWFRASDDPRGIQGLYDVDVHSTSRSRDRSRSRAAMCGRCTSGPARSARTSPKCDPHAGSGHDRRGNRHRQLGHRRRHRREYFLAPAIEI